MKLGYISETLLQFCIKLAKDEGKISSEALRNLLLNLCLLLLPCSENSLLQLANLLGRLVAPMRQLLFVDNRLTLDPTENSMVAVASNRSARAGERP